MRRRSRRFTLQRTHLAEQRLEQRLIVGTQCRLMGDAEAQVRMGGIGVV